MYQCHSGEICDKTGKVQLFQEKLTGEIAPQHGINSQRKLYSNLF